jgi:hypothetical protein
VEGGDSWNIFRDFDIVIKRQDDGMLMNYN